MTESNELLILLNNYLKHLSDNYENNNPILLDDSKYILLNEKINLILNNYKELSNLDLSNLKNILPLITDSDYTLLSYYQIIIRDTTFELSTDDRDKINEIINNIKILISKYFDEYTSLKLKRENEKNKLIEPYILLINKIKNGNKLNSDNVQLIYDVIKLSNLDVTDSIRIMKYIFSETFNRKENELNDSFEEEIIILEDTNLDLDELSDLFNKYNIDFNRFKENYRNNIRINGDLGKIEEILKVFSKYNINISWYLDEKGDAISRILLYSDAQLITKLFEELISYGILDRNAIDFSSLLENPSVFLSRRKKYKKKNIKNGGNSRNSGGSLNNDKRHIVSGCQEDLFKNLKYFSNLVSDVSELYESCRTAFYQPHEKILNDIKTFYLYNITEKYYLKSLVCFCSSNVADLIDMFIELDQFDYLVNNLSHLYKKSSSLMFYKLARARQLGIKFELVNSKMPGVITNDNYEYFGVKRIDSEEDRKRGKKIKHNGEEITEQYVFEFNAKKIYDDIIKENTNNLCDKVLEQEKEFINLLDRYYLGKFEDGYPNKRLYNIDGILFSRLKFLRIYNTLVINGIQPSLDCVMYALTRNSIITKNEFDLVYQNISNLYFEYDKKRGVHRK